MKYEHFNLKFNGLDIVVKLLDNQAYFPNGDKKNYVEEFKVLVSNEKNEISFKFYNSITEREISELLNDKTSKDIFGFYGQAFNLRAFRLYMTKRHMWGGYDDVKSLKELTRERIFNLSYSILNGIALNLNTETESFKWFCDCFGYDNDIIKARKIFNSVVDLKEKLESLEMNNKQRTYLNEEINQETEKFNKDLRKTIFNH